MVYGNRKDANRLSSRQDVDEVYQRNRYNSKISHRYFMNKYFFIIIDVNSNEPQRVPQAQQLQRVQAHKVIKNKIVIISYTNIKILLHITFITTFIWLRTRCHIFLRKYINSYLTELNINWCYLYSNFVVKHSMTHKNTWDPSYSLGHWSSEINYSWLKNHHTFTNGYTSC